MARIELRATTGPYGVTHFGHLEYGNVGRLSLLFSHFSVTQRFVSRLQPLQKRKKLVLFGSQAYLLT